MQKIPKNAIIINTGTTNCGFGRFLNLIVDKQVIVITIKYIIQYFFDLIRVSLKPFAKPLTSNITHQY